ncbi:MAG TPA: trehalase family glycosidase [Candidatus Saccharimonadales bacterium]|nr:trehalase family glycosidase [Candidatus Saccharimonadales bacterium]
MDEPADLVKQARSVLELNDQGSFTIPAEGLYPHQWLWDSCFIAIGIRNYDVERAKGEILSLLRGQWSNGMLPHMILGPNHGFVRNSIWRSWLNPNSPDDLVTSGITQPPLLAEAVVQIGRKMKMPERRSWYQLVFPALVAHHEWLYRERDPHQEGLILQIHPWETGLDNTPPWMNEIHNHSLPLWIRMVEKSHLAPLLNLFRRDTHRIPAEQRLNIIDALVLYSTQRRLRRKNYEIDKILAHSLFAVEDLTFNCILIRANQHLITIAKTIRKQLPEELLANIKKTEDKLEQLWDPYSNQYYSRNFVTHKLLKESTIATLLPLYAGTVSEKQAKQLVKLLENQNIFGPAYPVPSVPINSTWFKPTGYWQGPTWLNTNWLIIDGLKRYGFDEHAEALIETSLEMVNQAGFFEYFNPLTGDPAGAHNFSWTAALAIDLIKQ